MARVALTASEILERAKSGEYTYTVERVLKSFIEYRVVVKEWSGETVIRVHKSQAI